MHAHGDDNLGVKVEVRPDTVLKAGTVLHGTQMLRQASLYGVFCTHSKDAREIQAMQRMGQALKHGVMKYGHAPNAALTALGVWRR